MTKMPLYGHKGLELLREGILVFRLVRDELKGGFILSGFCRKEYRLKRKKEGREKKRGKTEGFGFEDSVCGSPNHFPSFFLRLSSVES